MAKNKQNAFTIIELMVAMALLVMMIALSGLIFRKTVEAHRTAGATIDITRSLRAVTSQLNMDFRGLRKEAPVFFWFERQAADGRRFDMVHFFADGDFQTTRLYTARYDSNNDSIVNNLDVFQDEVIYGQTARVYYGHANSVDLLNTPATADYFTQDVLSRKSHLLTFHDGLRFDWGEIPAVTGNPMYAPFASSFGLTTYSAGNPPKNYTQENGKEFNTITLSDWINALNFTSAGVPVNANHFVNACMSNNTRPYMSLSDFETLHLLQAQGVLSFSVQWAYTVDDLTTAATGYVPIPVGNANYYTGVRWWPSADPAGDGSVTSDFGIMGAGFGAYLSLPNGATAAGWNRVQPNNWETPVQMSARRCRTINANIYFRQDFYPKALKFTFTLKDSNGLFKDGKTFTHIVYLDNQ